MSEDLKLNLQRLNTALRAKGFHPDNLPIVSDVLSRNADFQTDFVVGLLADAVVEPSRVTHQQQHP